MAKRNEKKNVGNAAVAKGPMDPALIQAFSKGRNSGFKEGFEQGEVEGMYNALAVFNSWVSEVDKHVKGIGPSKREEIQKYFNAKIEESFVKKEDTEK